MADERLEEPGDERRDPVTRSLGLVERVLELADLGWTALVALLALVAVGLAILAHLA